MALLELVELTKLGLSIAVWCYVYFFLRNTEDYIERRPWEYLYIACMALFLFELISFLQIFRARAYGAEFFNHIKGILELAFLGLLLLAFLNQHQLLAKQNLIVLAHAKPKNGVKAELQERQREYDELREETQEATAAEKKAEAVFERNMSELPKGATQVEHDEEYLQLERKAQEFIGQSEELLMNSQGADPIRVALFRDELMDLKDALMNPFCTKDRLKKKLKTIMDKD